MSEENKFIYMLAQYGLVQYQGNYMHAVQFCKIIGEGEVRNQKPLFYIQDSPNSCLNSYSIRLLHGTGYCWEIALVKS